MKKLLKVMSWIYNYLNPHVVEELKKKETHLLYKALVSLYNKCECEHILNNTCSAMCPGFDEYEYSGYFNIGYDPVPFTLTKHRINTLTSIYVDCYCLQTPFVRITSYNNEVLITDIPQNKEIRARELVELLKKGELNDQIKC